MQIRIWRKAAERNALEGPGCFKECEGRNQRIQQRGPGTLRRKKWHESLQQLVSVLSFGRGEDLKATL